MKFSIKMYIIILVIMVIIISNSKGLLYKKMQYFVLYPYESLLVIYSKFNNN